MNDILERIVASKLEEIVGARARLPETELEKHLAEAPAPRDFRGALVHADGVAIIAEVKKASPSAGVICAEFDPVAIAKTYERHGAACISVLTDTPYFQGHLTYLSAIRDEVQIPVLRKDFILQRYQLLEARLAGADAVLLIAEILDDTTLRHLLQETRELGMQALVEVYEGENLDRVLECGATVIGINNRNLRTFQTCLDHTLNLAHRVPSDRCLVSESGICTRADIERLRMAGVKAVLVGETLMSSADPGEKLRELRGA